MGLDLRNTYWSAVIKSVHSRKCNPSNSSPRQCLMASLSGMEISLALFLCSLGRSCKLSCVQSHPEPMASKFIVSCPQRIRKYGHRKIKKNTDSLRKIENEFTRLGQAPKEKPPCTALIVCAALSFMGFIERIQWSLSRLTRDLVFSVHIMGPVNEKSICPVLVVLALPKNFLSGQGRGHMTSWWSTMGLAHTTKVQLAPVSLQDHCVFLCFSDRSGGLRSRHLAHG